MVNLAKIQGEGQWCVSTPTKTCSDEVDLQVLGAEHKIRAEGAIEIDSAPKRFVRHKEPVPGSAHGKGISKVYGIALRDMAEYLGEQFYRKVIHCQMSRMGRKGYVENVHTIAWLERYVWANGTKEG